MQAFLTLFYLLGLRKSFGVCAHDFEHLLEAIEGINVPCFLLRWFGSDAFPSCPRVQSAIVIHCVLFLENRIYVNTIIIFSCTSHVGEKKGQVWIMSCYQNVHVTLSPSGRTFRRRETSQKHSPILFSNWSWVSKQRAVQQMGRVNQGKMNGQQKPSIQSPKSLTLAVSGHEIVK